MFVVDTNILIYAANADSPEHVKCRTLMESWRRQATPWYLTWGTIYEFLRVTTHRNVFRPPWSLRQAWTFVESLLASPGLGMLVETAHHPEVAAEVFGALASMQGNVMHDAHTAILMREHGIKTIFTRDTHFNRFPFLEVVDPIAGVRRTTPKRAPRGSRS